MTGTELMSPDQIREQVCQTTNDLWQAMRDGNEERIVEMAHNLKALVGYDQSAALAALREDPDQMDSVIMRLWATQGLTDTEIGEIFGLSRKSIVRARERAVKVREDLEGSDPRNQYIMAAVTSYREVIRQMYPKMAAGSIQATKNYLAAQDNLCRLLGLNAPDKKLLGIGAMGQPLRHVVLPEKDAVTIGLMGEIVEGEFAEGDSNGPET